MNDSELFESSAQLIREAEGGNRCYVCYEIYHEYACEYCEDEEAARKKREEERKFWEIQ